MTRRSLPEKVVGLHECLTGIGTDSTDDPIPHAFGGAIALAYYAEARATIDIDLNLFVAADHADAVATRLAALGVTGSVALVGRDGQARLAWDDTPIDLFFSYDRFHDTAAQAVRLVPFADTTIPILAPEHLVVCKVIFDRPKDWVDIDAMRAEDTAIDAAVVLRWIGRIVGDTDPRYNRIAAFLTS